MRSWMNACVGWGLLVGSSLSGAEVANEAGWSQFRGPNASGVAATGAPPTEFGPEKNLKWKVAVPAGLSCPSVAGDQIYLTTFENGTLAVLALSLADGSEVWRQTIPAKSIEAYHKTEGSPAAASVATDGTHVVAYFGSYGLICFDSEGTLLWKSELPLAETHNGFGSGVSPILVDGRVILVRDLANESTMLSLDVKTGDQQWKITRSSLLTAYGTPIVWDTPLGKELVVPAALMLQGYDLATGKEKWVIRNLPAVNCTSPVVAGDLLVYAGWSPGDEEFKMPTFDELLKGSDTNGNEAISAEECKNSFLANFFENNDTDKDGEIERSEWDVQIEFLTKGVNRMVAIKPGAMGDATASHVVWEKKRGLPYVPSVLGYQNRIYVIKDGGILSCVNAQTGKSLFEQKRLEATGGYYASPIAANNHVYLASLDGVITVIAAQDELNVVSQNTLGERIATTPAVVGDLLLVRSANHLWAFGK